MEFLLINHPLDCPICDQAGECRLQEFSDGVRAVASSRFLERRRSKSPKTWSSGRASPWMPNAASSAPAASASSKEVAKDDVLGFVDRGSYSRASLPVIPDRVLDNNYSLNTVDICPVGALTSSDFRFKMRVWFLKETKTICTSCNDGLGANIGDRQHAQEPGLSPVMPRENNEVNGSLAVRTTHRLNFPVPACSEDRLIAAASSFRRGAPDGTIGRSAHRPKPWRFLRNPLRGPLRRSWPVRPPDQRGALT